MNILDSSKLLLMLLITTMVSVSCADANNKPPSMNLSQPNSMDSTQRRDVAILAGGCFWCIEAVYELVDGVISVESGYIGGLVENPSYKEVCDGTTGHAEACRITFDPSVISFADLLQVFFASHDPTTLNRQGNDVGTQYRSAIFTLSEEQAATSREYIKQLDASKTWSDPVVTEIAPAGIFYKAEDYHQNYYERNGSQPYCAFVVRPKVEKFRKQFKDRLRSDAR
ncbi:MAG: peptide-methionine (S)-S-oxide reductase MsrA [Candidatus Kapaibacterium sp.]